ncbi:MAG: arylsulfatase [Planctomycetota bacterium]|nr:arylsulfatase [Planctomycetota bacterium]
MMRYSPGLSLLLLVLVGCTPQIREPIQTPNIIYIMADDLGWGDLSCYGQEVLKTPNIDQLAAEGIRFTDHYSGHTVCRPSRLVLWTGMHSGHTALQSNAYYRFDAGERTVVQILQESGYATAGCGKWAMGRQGSAGHPNRKGFDDWFGYLDQGDAHNYYPTHLWHNETRVPLPGNRLAGEKGRDAYHSIERNIYSHDVIVDWLLQWIRDHSSGPFLMHAHLTIPHANNERGYASGNGMEVPSLEQFAREDWPEPEKGFAAMIALLDQDVGRIVSLLKELGIHRNTLVIFTSDNGPHSEGGHKHQYFNSNGPFRGFKRDLLEGGIRIPMIAYWPGSITPGSTSNHPSGFQDFLPTACNLAGVPVPEGIDGISYLPTLLGSGDQKSHEQLYWRFKDQEALRTGHWKILRDKPDAPVMLHDLRTDLEEKENLADSQPEVLKDLVDRMNRIRFPEQVNQTTSSEK